MLKSALTLLFLSYSFFVFSQGQANNWYFGNKAGLSFNNGTPEVLTDGEIITIEGVCTISDKDGNLHLYSDGSTVWDRNHNIMPNGTDLLGDSSSTQSGILVPHPKFNEDPSYHIYYLITVDDNSGSDGLRYNIIDMNLNGGLGDLTLKNELLNPSSTEKVTAIHHANKRGYWVIAHERGNNNFVSYLIDGTTINTTPVVSSIGSITGTTFVENSAGYLKASPDGKKLANAISTGIEIYDFDNSTGALSNLIFIPYSSSNQTLNYGVEFSPNSKYVYTSIIDIGSGDSTKLFRYDISLGNATAIENSRIELISTSNCRNDYQIGALQLAPDGNIYVAQSILNTVFDYEYLGVIKNPDAIFPSYNCQEILFTTAYSRLGLPAFVQSFFITNMLDADGFCLNQPTQFTLSSTDTIDSVLWNFGDGNTSAEMNPSHTYTNPGTYNVVATITSGGTSIDEEIEVTIYNTPIHNTVATYQIEESPFDGIADFDLTTKDTEILNGQSSTDLEIFYFLTQDDATNNTNAIASPFTNTSNPQTIFSRIQNRNDTTCFQTSSFQIEVINSSSIGTVSDFPICSLTPSTVTFDLNSKDNEVLNGQNSADFNISYHLSQNDADNNVNPLASPYPYTDTSMPLPVFVRLETISDPTQFESTSFNLIVSQTPTITTPNDIIVCDDNTNDGVESFDFTTTIRGILNGQDPTIFSVTLFASQNDLDTNVNPLPTTFQNTLPQQQIFAKIENIANPNCTAQTSFMIGVSYSPFSVHPQDVIVCKDPIVNNTVTIDLSDYILEILGSQNPADFTVTYHANENDANADQNPLPDVFSTTKNREQIVYRIENNLNTDCYINATLTLIVNNSPSIGTLTDVTICDDNNDGTVIFDLSSKDNEALAGQDSTMYQVLYFASQSDLDNNLNPLPTDYQNTLAQEQIFVRIHAINDIDCYNQSSFNITVTPSPIIASTPLDLNNCGSSGIATFNLTENDAIILGNQSDTDVSITYHTSNNDALNNTNAIPTPDSFASQQDGEEIFIRIESISNTDCFTTGSFTLNVFETPTITTPNDIEICDANAAMITYDLAASIPEILGTQDASLFDISFYNSQTDADARTNELDLTQETSNDVTTIFARIENIGFTDCYQTTSFDILKRASPVISIADEVFICPREALVVTANTGYDTYQWSTGETSESITITTPGEYSVTVTENHDSVRCSSTKTFNVMTSDIPESIEVIINDFKPSSKNSIQIIATGNGDFEYSIDGISFQDSNLFNNIASGDYTAFVRDKGQCMTLSKEFYVLGYPLFFTPNGDGFNEVWQIQNADKEPDNVVYIFDRYGKLLTRFTQADIGWNGIYNGKQMPSSDYWFKVERQNGQVIKGHFTLKR